MGTRSTAGTRPRRVRLRRRVRGVRRAREYGHYGFGDGFEEHSDIGEHLDGYVENGVLGNAYVKYGGYADSACTSSATGAWSTAGTGRRPVWLRHGYEEYCDIGEYLGGYVENSVIGKCGGFDVTARWKGNGERGHGCSVKALSVCMQCMQDVSELCHVVVVVRLKSIVPLRIGGAE